MHIKSSPTLRTATLTTGTSWRTTAITAALGVLLSTAHLNALALALGPITSLSALGEPLAAGIAVPEITPEEFSSLKVTLATPDGFKAAGMDYNPALSSAQFTLNRRPDGTTYLLLRSDKMVTDPFVNLVVTAKWSNGQIVRNYTLLLDPPTSRQSETSTITAPLTALPPAPAPARSAAPAPAPRSEPLTAASAAAPTPAPAVAARPAVEAKPSPVQATKQSAATPPPAPGSKNNGEQVKIAAGDTAGKIAANNRPANVSLDQMLIAMLRGNPDAFVGNNINRLKSGAILSLPTSEEAQAIPDSTARQAVLAQSKDFNGFRRKLAENVPNVASKSADRQAGGKIEAKVEDRKAAAATPDKLTLSKGSLNADPKATAKDGKDNSDKIAKERQAKDDAARVAELSKNITDLNKIAGTTPAVPVKPAAGNAPAAPASPSTTAATSPAAAGKAASAVALTAPTAVVAATTTVSAPAATNAAPAATTSATPSTPAATGAPAAATPAAATVTTPAAATTPQATPAVSVKPVIVTKAPVSEPSFLDDLMGNPAVLPAAGGLLVLLAAGGLYAARKRKNRVEEEDPDTEFEEQSFFNTTSHATDVHEEALIAPVAVDTPTTAAGPTFDLPAMPVATETPVALAPMTMPELPTRAVAQAAAPLTAALAEDKFPDFTPSEFSERTVAQLDPESAKSPASVDLDLDFDFASDFPAAAPSPSPVVAEIKPAAAPVAAIDHHSLDFDMPALSATGAGAGAAVAAAAAATAAHVSHTTQATQAPAVAPAALANHVAPLDFNMDSLSLDLNANNKQTSAAAANAIGPLETKLALAQEFRAIGDATGAKMLAQEVIALASGSLKIKAETLLTEIG